MGKNRGKSKKEKQRKRRERNNRKKKSRVRNARSEEAKKMQEMIDGYIDHLVRIGYEDDEILRKCRDEILFLRKSATKQEKEDFELYVRRVIERVRADTGARKDAQTSKEYGLCLAVIAMDSLINKVSVEEIQAEHETDDIAPRTLSKKIMEKAVLFYVDKNRSREMRRTSMETALEEVFEDDTGRDLFISLNASMSVGGDQKLVLNKIGSQFLITGAQRLGLKPSSEKWPFETLIISANAMPIAPGKCSFPGVFVFTQDLEEGVTIFSCDLQGECRTVDDYRITFDPKRMHVNVVYADGAWCKNNDEEWSENDQGIDPWYVVALLNTVINERSNIVISGKERPKLVEHSPSLTPQVRKQQLPYYPVELKRNFGARNRKEREGAEARRLKYRHSRIGHEKAFIRRGPLPLHPSKRRYYLAKHMDAGVRIYENGSMSDHDIELLTERGMPLKRDDEWMVIWTRWVKDTIVGDENLPFIPSSRV